MNMNGHIRGYDPNEVLPGLLASQCGSKDEPRVHFGPIPLDAFRLLPKWNKNRHFVFVMAMHYASGERRINAGHKGLMVEAARTIIRLFASDVRRIYRERGVLVHVSDAMLTDLASAYAAEIANDPELKREVVNSLDVTRQLIAHDPALAAFDGLFSSYNEHQSPITTMNMWRDYADILSKHSANTIPFNLRRWIYSCARVHDAVFLARFD